VKLLSKVPSFCAQALSPDGDLTWMTSGIMWVKDISLTPAPSSTRENQPYLNNKMLTQQLAIIMHYT
jgi:hypothetical protein